jgi:DNA-binding response OmpR family regulator
VPRHDAARRRLRILVVDDNLDQVHTLAYLLRDLGHQVDYAINGLAGADIAQRTIPDVVLLDMCLPDTSGVHVARELRRNSRLIGTSIVGISGLPLNRAEVAGAGFDDVLTKPVDLRELRAILRRR